MSRLPPQPQDRTAHAESRDDGARGVLVVGLGGLGCPALRVLAQSGVTRFTLVDDDTVDLTNLQRQVLYTERDVGRLKAEVARERVTQLSPTPERMQCRLEVTRFTPDNALSLARGHALILEGADNYATKFLAADAARLTGVPIVQAGAVRFGGWALASDSQSACLRCLFEDIPRDMPETCGEAGVLGPVVGVLGALEAALALALGSPKAAAAGQFFSYDALPGALRRRRLGRRPGCALCEGEIHDLDLSRYVGACAA